MAVYTQLGWQQFEKIVRSYSIGSLCTYCGIEDGSTNSNYILATDEGQFVLTLYETAQTIYPMVSLLRFLRTRPVAAVQPLSNRQGDVVGQFKNKSFILCPFEAGNAAERGNSKQLQNLAIWLAEFHLSCLHFPMPNYNRGKPWQREITKQLSPQLNRSEQDFLLAHLAWQADFQINDLPTGVIHGDLFRDNVLFRGDRLNVVIDFENAGVYALLFDLAVVVNDWCSLPNGVLDLQLMQKFLFTYNRVRMLSPEEQAVWPKMLLHAALRFYLSRMLSHLDPSSPPHASQPDPLEYKSRLIEIRKRFEEIQFVCSAEKVG